MAQLDITVTQTQYDTMDTVFSGVEAKFDPLVPVLTRILQMENGKDKIKTFVQNEEDARWLKRLNQFKNYLDNTFEQIGWDQ